MTSREDFLVQLKHMIDDLANLAADFGCDPDEIARAEQQANQTLVQLWEAEA